MTYLTEMDPETGFIDAGAVRDKGKELAEGYQAARPFPHVVIDDFLPRPLIDMCLAQFDRERGPSSEGDTFDREQERGKSQFGPDRMAEPARRLFYSFNSLPFIRVVQNVTGIRGLVPDPYFLGAGFHEIKTGGHLSMHADFNHHKPMDLERRVNVLIYLNDDWRDEHGGQLELWDKGMTRREQSIVPIANRCVMFSTTSHSMHGNPQPVSHPDGRSRKSIALYYYTATWDESRRDHTTQFRRRPGSADKVDWRVRSSELAADLLPPVLLRTARKAWRGVKH